MSSTFSTRPWPRRWLPILTVGLVAAIGSGVGVLVTAMQSPPAAFQRKVLAAALPEAPFGLRIFTGAVKTDSRGEIIDGPDTDPVKKLVGAEAAGPRAGMERFTKIMFGAGYFDGRPDKGTRINPNNPQLSSGSQHWPFVKQPFRSWPNSVAVTPDGRKLYVTLPGREGYPDWRVASVDTVTRRVVRWIDLRAGQSRGTRPLGIAVSPTNTSIYPRPYAVVANMYANFASIIDTGNDAVLGQFETGFYGEDLVFNAAGTRLYLTDRFKDQVRAFRIDPGPAITQIAEIPTGATDLDRTNPRDLTISADGATLYVGNTLGHTIAVVNIAGDVNTLVATMPVGGLTTDVKIAGRWGIVSGQSTNSVLNQRETGHGLPKIVNGVAIRNNGQALGYTPVMTDATRATTFDDLGSELNVFDTATNRFVYRYVDFERDRSIIAVPGQVVDLGDHVAGQKIIRGSGPEQIAVKGDFLFVSQLHSDKIEVFRINQNPVDPSQILTQIGTEFTGGISPQGLTVSPDGTTIYVANMQTEDVSFLGVSPTGALTRQGHLAVGVTDSTPDPTNNGGSGHGDHLFATHEEIGLRWLFTQSYSDDGQKSCGHCHWQSRHDGGQWNVGANAIGGPKVCPLNKDISDNWPEWYEGLSSDMNSYASSCNGELVGAENLSVLFPQATQAERLQARNEYVMRKTAENSAAIGRPELSGKAASIGFYDMAFFQILWSQNETRLMPNPLRQAPTSTEAAAVARGKLLFTNEVAQGGAGCASCHHNGNKTTNGVVDDTFQDFNVHEPGVIAEITVDNEGPFTRLGNDYFFKEFNPPQDLGGRQNISSRNTKHLRSFWDSVPRWLHHGDAHTIREILLTPDSPLLHAGERGFNFRTVRTDHSRVVAFDFLGGPEIRLPTEVPITFADSSDTGNCSRLAGDGKGRLCVSLDSPFNKKPGRNPAFDVVAYPEGRLEIDQLGTSNVVPLIVGGQINPALAANHIRVIADTHGKTSHLAATDIEALSMYLKSLQK